MWRSDCRGPTRAPPPSQPDPVSATPDEAALFAAADADGDGRVAGAEAVAFFETTGLPPATLAAVWEGAKAAAPGAGDAAAGLDLAQFAAALRLTAAAQARRPVDAGAAAVAGALPALRPAARAGPPPLAQARSAGRRLSRDASVTAKSPVSTDAWTAPAEEAGDGVVATAALGRALTHGGRATVGAAAASAAPVAHADSDAVAAAVRASGDRPAFAADARLPPPAVDVRLPPLRPKQSARLATLAAGADCLFAAPAAHGGALQWAGAGAGRPGPPAGADRASAAAAEDGDAAPAAELRPEAGWAPATATLWDAGRSVLWLGHADGRVSGARVGSRGLLAAADPRLALAAHRAGAVTALALTPCGQLWTGSSRGALRAWRLDGAGRPAADEGSSGVGPVPTPDGPRPHALCRPGGARAHGGGVVAIAASAAGGVVWTAGARSLALWCARSGAFLAALEPGLAPPPPPPRFDEDRVGAFNDDAAGRAARVDPAVGLDADAAGDPLAAPPAADREARAAEQRLWAAAADTRTAELLGSLGAAGGRAAASAGRAAKLIGRLGARIVRQLGSDAGEGGGGAVTRPSDGGTGVAPGTPTGGGERRDDAAPAADGGPRALVALPCGAVVAAFRGGRVLAFTAAGRQLWAADVGGRGGCTAAAALPGARVWVGARDGSITALDAATGLVLGAWPAHAGGAVVAVAAAGRRAYSLAADGGLRAWSAASPSTADPPAAAALASALPAAAAPAGVAAVVLTWNVNQRRPPPDSPLFASLADLARDADVAVLCLQEIEMGGSSVALAAAREAVAPGLQEKGTAAAQWWAAAALDALGGPSSWARVGLRQLSGMLVLVFAREFLMVRSERGRVRGERGEAVPGADLDPPPPPRSLWSATCAPRPSRAASWASAATRAASLSRSPCTGAASRPSAPTSRRTRAPPRRGRPTGRPLLGGCGLTPGPGGSWTRVGVAGVAATAPPPPPTAPPPPSGPRIPIHPPTASPGTSRPPRARAKAQASPAATRCSGRATSTIEWTPSTTPRCTPSPQATGRPCCPPTSWPPSARPAARSSAWPRPPSSSRPPTNSIEARRGRRTTRRRSGGCRRGRTGCCSAARSKKAAAAAAPPLPSPAPATGACPTCSTRTTSRCGRGWRSRWQRSTRQRRAPRRPPRLILPMRAGRRRCQGHIRSPPRRQPSPCTGTARPRRRSNSTMLPPPLWPGAPPPPTAPPCRPGWMCARWAACWGRGNA